MALSLSLLLVQHQHSKCSIEILLLHLARTSYFFSLFSCITLFHGFPQEQREEYKKKQLDAFWKRLDSPRRKVDDDEALVQLEYNTHKTSVWVGSRLSLLSTGEWERAPLSLSLSLSLSLFENVNEYVFFFFIFSAEISHCSIIFPFRYFHFGYLFYKKAFLLGVSSW